MFWCSDIHIHCEMMTTTMLMNTFTTHSYPSHFLPPSPHLLFVLVAQTLKIHPLSKLEGCDTVLTVVTSLHLDLQNFSILHNWKFANSPECRAPDGLQAGRLSETWDNAASHTRCPPRPRGHWPKVVLVWAMRSEKARGPLRARSKRLNWLLVPVVTKVIVMVSHTGGLRP